MGPTVENVRIIEMGEQVWEEGIPGGKAVPGPVALNEGR